MVAPGSIPRRSTPEAVTVDRGPSRFGLVLSVAAMATAAAALLVVSATAAVVTLAGAFVLALGVRSRVLALRDAGTIGMLGGPILAGLAADAAVPPLVAAVAVVLARDTVENALELGAQLGARARTRRAESVHAAGTLLVGVAGAALGSLIFSVAGGGRPVSAVVILLVGGVLLLWSLRSSSGGD